MKDDFVGIKEGSGYKDLKIEDGYLNLETVYIQFRGNTQEAAEAIVSYNGN